VSRLASHDKGRFLAGVQAGTFPYSVSFITVAILLAALVLPAESIAVSADPDPVTVFVRVVGPVDESTFGDTGEYETIWAGEVTVPPEVTVTSANERQYRLFVEDGLYKGTRLSDSTTWELGEGDDTLGATSVLAALHQASLLGGFTYEITDSYFPGSGFYVTSIADVDAHGAVGWAYRVWNDTVAPTPSQPVDRFMLNYADAEPASPHSEVVLFWGAGYKCKPLRITGPASPVQCGDVQEFFVEYFADEGYTGTGTWEALEGARVCVGDEYCVTGTDGIAEVAFQQTGQYTVVAEAAPADENYYIPSDGRLVMDVEGPCTIISFTIEDHGDPGIDFGAVVRGTPSTPEVSQTAGQGAVTLSVGPETTVACSLRIKGVDTLSGPSSSTIALSAIEWDTDSSGGTATPVSDSYAEVGTAAAGVSTDVDVWLWLSILQNQGYGVYSGELRFEAVEQGT